MTVLRSGSATHVGRVRKINQDLPLESTNLFAVADGMGGHVGGEVAARVAVETLEQSFAREPTTVGLQDAFREANQAVWQESQANADLRGMGTTLTAIALVGGADGRDVLALGNVGDSRAYIYSDHRLVQVTADHSLAEERMRHGEMTEEEAAVHPQRHILTRALGVSSEVETDMWELQLKSGDRIVLCSDGLSNELALDELAEILEAQSDPTEAAHQLVDGANAHGGSDNITVVVVDVLVGEEGSTQSSVVTPIGERAGAPLILAADAATGVVAVGAGAADLATGSPDAPDAVTGLLPASGRLDDTAMVPRVDALAPGARLGFSRQTPELAVEEANSGEFFLGAPGAVPLARSTTRVPPPRPTAAPPADESRRARRRRLGIPRRITLRVVLFVLLVLAVPSAAFFAIRWYAYDNWYVAVSGNQIVIKQGHPGGVLWFQPKVVAKTGVSASAVLAPGLAEIKSGVQEPSLDDAKRFVANLHSQYVTQTAPPRVSTTTTAPTTTTTLGPGVGPNISGSTVPGGATNTTAAPTGATVPTTTAPGAP